MRRSKSFAKSTKALSDIQQIGIIAVAIATILAVAILIATLRVPNTGTIKTIGLEASIDAIDWGEIYPTEIKHVSFTVTNNGTTDGTLTMTIEGLISDLVCTWDSEGAFLAANQTKTVTIQLEAKPTATEQDFGFDIILTLTAEGGEQS